MFSAKLIVRLFQPIWLKALEIAAIYSLIKGVSLSLSFHKPYLPEHRLGQIHGFWNH